MEKYKFSQYNIVIDQDDQYTTIYNCYTGGIIKLENDAYNFLVKNSEVDDTVLFADELICQGYLINSKIDEYNRVKIQLDNTINAPNQSVVSYVIAPTLNCNLKCVYCFQKNTRDTNSNATISNDLLEQIARFILNSNRDNPTVKSIKITWFGGEPLLCYDKIISFSKLLKLKLQNKNISLITHMITNGVLLNEKRLMALVHEANLEHIQITLDGEVQTYCSKKQTTKNNYFKVVENICRATRLVRTVVRVNADKANFEELKRLAIALLHNSAINKENLKFSFAQLRDYTHDICCQHMLFDDYEYWKYKNVFYSVLKEHGYCWKDDIRLPNFVARPFCGVSLYRNFVIDYYGNLYKCEHYIGQDGKIVGNIIDGVYYNSIYNESISLVDDEKCHKCCIYPFCNYSQCSVMHDFTGDDMCLCYEKQLKVIKEKVKRYLVMNESNFKSSQ